MSKTIYSVSKVNAFIKHLIDSEPLLENISVRGEISNLNDHSSNHLYFSLKDDNSVIKCVMFSGNRRTGLDFIAKDGMQVVVHGRLSTYVKSGIYQIYVNRMENDGSGYLYEKFEELKLKLYNEGLFDEAFKKPIPKYATKIGVVTSSTGAVIQDIKNVSNRRNPYVNLYLYPSKVQGDGAAETIVKGIKQLDKMGLDVIIIGRGGGSIEDLWPFNEEIVANAIFDAKTPIISAVGHEINFTISDMVADMRAPTPSAAAELAVFSYDDFIMDLNRRRNILSNKVWNIFEDTATNIVNANETLSIRMEKSIINASSMVEHYKKRLLLLNPRFVLNNNKEATANYRMRISTMMKKHLMENAVEIDMKKRKLRELINNHVEKNKSRIRVEKERLSAHDVKKNLSRGYSLVMHDGKRLNSINDVAIGESLDLILVDGSLRCNIQEKKEDKDA